MSPTLAPPTAASSAASSPLFHAPQVTCHPGLETVLGHELRNLQIPYTVAAHPRHVLQLDASTSLEQLYHCHLQLGTASYLMVALHERPLVARNLHQLERHLRRLPWDDIFTEDPQRIHVRVTAQKSKLMHTNMVQRCVTRQLQAFTNVTDGPMGPRSEDSITIALQVSIVRDRVRISLLSLPQPLHRRNYRLQTAKAPLREDLAFALLHAAGWTTEALAGTDREPMYQGFIDPCCGSGTIAIEAAAMAHALPPGRLLPPPFQGTTLCDTTLWNQLVREATARPETHAGGPRIMASDRDQGAVDIAIANAKRANVLQWVEFRHAAVSSHPVWESPAPGRLLVASNLPFGRRVSHTHTKSQTKLHPLLPLYQSLASRIQRLRQNGSQVALMALIHDGALARQAFGKLAVEPRLETSHGGIPVSGWFSHING